MADARPDFPAQVDTIRRFNRFYTRRIGVLRDGLLSSPFTLAQARVLYELAQRERPSASEIARELDLDAGYLSRLLRALMRRGLVSRAPSPTDRRRGLLALTARGRAAFRRLDRRSASDIATMLEPLAADDRQRLADAMASIERLLAPDGPAGERPAAAGPIVLRTHRPGDLGWVVHRHAALYAQEYGWDGSFEAMVAEIVARFIRRFDPARERCWIAERDGRILGSVTLVRMTDATAQLRLLYVEPQARGAGLGRLLVDECERFARQAGYRRIRLWTNSVLLAARAIYEGTGYRLIAQEPHRSFGHDLVGETWEKRL
jgi:DNA-binding MarR family transcriptional regulator/N-acetylglutamate synthase-like GNAT family acetyltransferase